MRGSDDLALLRWHAFLFAGNLNIVIHRITKFNWLCGVFWLFVNDLICVLAPFRFPHMSVSAFAASEPPQYQQDMNVTAISYSTFNYSIPETLEVYSEYTEFQLSISNCDVAEGFGIEFHMMNGKGNGVLELTNTKDETKKADVQFFNENKESIPYGDIAVFTSTDIANNNNSKKAYASLLNGDSTPAGTYTGTVNFYVMLVEEQS